MYATGNLENNVSKGYETLKRFGRKLVGADYEGSAQSYKGHRTGLIIAGSVAAAGLLGIINFPMLVDAAAYLGTVYNGTRAMKDKKQLI